MLKKAVGFITSLALAASMAATCFADSNVSTSSDESSYSESVESTDTDATEDDEETTSLDEQKAEVEKYALENEDPQYGKYLEALGEEEASTDSTPVLRSLTSMGATSLGYSNSSLTHNSKFDDMDKVWGVDVSYYQYDIDWDKVKADGIDFAIIRVGYRGYGSAGTLVLDYKFEENIQGAIDAGLEVGVYFYTQAINTTEAKAEADFVLKYISDYDLDMPVYFDIESVDYATGRLDSANLSKSEKTALCKAFCERIEASGYDAGVYANKYWLTSMLNADELEDDYAIWLAQFSNEATYTGEYSTWQFTSSGSVSGINTSVDVDVDYRSDTISNFKLTQDGSSATLTWTAMSSATGYQVCRYDSSTGKYTSIKKVTTNSATITLKNGYYGYCVRPYYTKSGTTTYGTYSKIIYAARNIAVNLSATKSASSIRLSWDATSGVTGYDVYLAIGTSGSYSKYTSTTSTSIKISGLSSATYYRFKVRTYVTNGSTNAYGLYSDELGVATKPKKASQPKYVSSGSNSIKVSWSSVSGASGYQIAVYDSSTGKYTVKKTVGKNVTSATVTGLSSATSYQLAVRAYCTYNSTNTYGSYSETTTMYTANAAPTIYTSASTSSIKITWEKVKKATYYTIYRKTSSGYTKLGTTTATSYKITNVTSGTKKYYVTASMTKNGITYTSDYSNLSEINTSTLASPSFTSSSSSTGKITLKWNKVSGTTGYRIYKYDTTTKKYVKVKTITSANKTKYTVTGLTSSTTYKFVIKAYKKGTEAILWSAKSSAYSVKTKSMTLPAKVIIKSSVSSSGKIKLTWNKLSNCSGYRVYMYDTSKKKYVRVATIHGSDNCSYKITGLTSGTTYKFKVKGYTRNSSGVAEWGEASNVYKATTKTLTLPAKASFKSYTSTSSSITLKWNKLSNCKGYRVYMYDSSKKKYVKVKTISGASNCSYTVTGLESGTTYKFKVKGYTRNSSKVAEWGQASNTYKATTKS